MATLKQLQSCSVHILHALATGCAPGSVRRAEDETNIFEPGYFLFSRIVVDLQQPVRNRRPAQVTLSPRSRILLHRIDSKCQHSFHSRSVRACISPCPESTGLNALDNCHHWAMQDGANKLALELSLIHIATDKFAAKNRAERSRNEILLFAGRASPTRGRKLAHGECGPHWMREHSR